LIVELSSHRYYAASSRSLDLDLIARYIGDEVIEHDIGEVIIGYEDRRAVVPVVFGEPGDASVLGVTALEALGYQPDPVTKRLKTHRVIDDLAH